MFILGVLVAIAMPNVLTTIQHSKLKRTIADMRIVARAIVSYRSHTGRYPPPGQLQGALVPAYLKLLPKDGWSHDFRYESWTSATGSKSYALGSAGKGGVFEYQSLRQYSQVERTTSFRRDIVLRDGRFILFPGTIRSHWSAKFGGIVGAIIFAIVVVNVVLDGVRHFVARARSARATPTPMTGSPEVAFADQPGNPEWKRKITLWEATGLSVIEVGGGSGLLEPSVLVRLVGDLLAAGRTSIVVDLSSVPALYPFDYLEMLKAIDEALEANVRLMVCGLQQRTLEMFSTREMGERVDIFPDREAAMGARGISPTQLRVTEWPAVS